MGQRVTYQQLTLTNTQPKIYLNARQLATYLNVQQKTVYSWVRRGWLMPERVGPRMMRFEKSRIDRWQQLFNAEPHSQIEN